jgi:hypothetical protein
VLLENKRTILLWAQELQFKNSSAENQTRSLECYATWMQVFLFVCNIRSFSKLIFSSDGVLVKQSLDCKEEISFVCTLPDECHKDVCASQCALNGVDLCNRQEKVDFKA